MLMHLRELPPGVEKHGRMHRLTALQEHEQHRCAILTAREANNKRASHPATPCACSRRMNAQFARDSISAMPGGTLLPHILICSALDSGTPSRTRLMT